MAVQIKKSYTYDLTTHFISEFKKIHGSVCCKDLLNGIDMSTPEGYAKVRELNLSEHIVQNTFVVQF